MLKPMIMAAAACWLPAFVLSQGFDPSARPAGTFSLGTRNTASLFHDDAVIGKGIGGQFRLRLGNKLNSEWFFDYISSANEAHQVYRSDYHIGWSLLFYMGNNFYDDRLFQPYFLAGHCFDLTRVTEQGNRENSAGRTSMATQAGLGTHINITPRFDCSVSAQYMLHFGKAIHTKLEEGITVITREDFTHMDGHALLTVSFNYKLFRLWRSREKK